jgi:raffinose/stachyose/melibiose transport system substrate-binding protein
MGKINAAFEAKYPNITIQRTVYAWADLRAKDTLAITGPNPPDVIQEAGIPAIGPALVQAGALVNLDPIADQYGWHDRFAPNYFQWAQFSSDGSQRGNGSIYGIAYQVEATVVFYNRTKLQALGLSAPATFADLQAALAAAKAAGETPILLGNLEQWPGGQFYQSVDYTLATPDQLTSFTDFSYGRKPAVSLTDVLSQGASTIQDWWSKGYINADANNLSVNDLAAQFEAGKGVFIVTTSLEAPSLAQAMGDGVGAFIMPPQQAGGPLVAPGAESTPFGIPTGSQHQAEAAMYLDFLTGPDGAAIAAAGGAAPVVPNSYQPPAGSLTAELLPELQALMTSNGLIPWFDGGTPSMVDTLGGVVQQVMAGQITPSVFTDTIMSDFNTAHP